MTSQRNQPKNNNSRPLYPFSYCCQGCSWSHGHAHHCDLPAPVYLYQRQVVAGFCDHHNDLFAASGKIGPCDRTHRPLLTLLPTMLSDIRGPPF